MIFQINKNSTLPILQMELITDSKIDFNKFNECIQNSDITFCVTNTETGAKIVGGKKAKCIIKYNPSNYNDEEYLLAYQFSEKETKTPGIYIGEFTINFLNDYGKLIVPIKEELMIHILDSQIKK